jgi:hypothetical protein
MNWAKCKTHTLRNIFRKWKEDKGGLQEPAFLHKIFSPSNRACSRLTKLTAANRLMLWYLRGKGLLDIRSPRFRLEYRHAY